MFDRFNAQGSNRVIGESLNEWEERKPHYNVGINSLKNIAKGSKTGVARFHITSKDRINAGDAYYFNHDDLIDQGHDWDKPHINGFVKHDRTDNTYKYNMYKDRDKHLKHPILDKMKDAGMEHKPDVALNENAKYLRDVVPLSEISNAGIEAMRKMISDKSTPHHEREAARAALHKHGHSETASHEPNWSNTNWARKPRPEAKSYKPNKPAAPKSDFKHYEKYAKDYHYAKQGTSTDTSGAPEEDHVVHHYRHDKGHKVELHMDADQKQCNPLVSYR